MTPSCRVLRREFFIGGNKFLPQTLAARFTVASFVRIHLRAQKSSEVSSYRGHLSKSQHIFQEDNVKAVFSRRPVDGGGFVLPLQLGPLKAWLVAAELWPEGICYSTTSVPVTLFSPSMPRDTQTLPRVAFCVPPLSIPSLSADVCSHNAAGL